MPKYETDYEVVEMWARHDAKAHYEDSKNGGTDAPPGLEPEECDLQQWFEGTPTDAEWCVYKEAYVTEIDRLKEDEESKRSTFNAGEMKKPFIYPERIPAKRALAVRNLLLGKGEDQERSWPVFADWVQEQGTVIVLQDIASILDYNGWSTQATARVMEMLSLRVK